MAFMQLKGKPYIDPVFGLKQGINGCRIVFTLYNILLKALFILQGFKTALGILVGFLLFNYFIKFDNLFFN